MQLKEDYPYIGDHLEMLSILYLRCDARSTRRSRALRLMTFNSLFEMRCIRRRRGWAYIHTLSFNSLFEMPQIARCRLRGALG